MLIGLGMFIYQFQYYLGGGSLSSSNSQNKNENLDFASVQRHNPEMQRRCQQVIDSCINEIENPITSIHDVGAGGLSNALPELVQNSNLGAFIDLRLIEYDELKMTPMEIWCNESQERYVLSIENQDDLLSSFSQICKRERCPFAIVGVAILDTRFILHDSQHGVNSIDMQMSDLFSTQSFHEIYDKGVVPPLKQFSIPDLSIFDLGNRVLQIPSVSSKAFLITIGDRSVTGLVSRDQMVGPWQVPVSDVSITCIDYVGSKGQAMSMGERPPISLISPSASARMAVGESLTNLIAANVKALDTVCLSANWMAAFQNPDQRIALYDAVNAIGMELCPNLGICIPVGKDSLSMRKSLFENNELYTIESPLSLIITAYGPVENVRKTLTPEIGSGDYESTLFFLDLANGMKRMGGSALAQSFNEIGTECPDFENPELFKVFWDFINTFRNLILAYHDRSDGGIFTTLCEMAFAGRTGLLLIISD